MVFEMEGVLDRVVHGGERCVCLRGWRGMGLFKLPYTLKINGHDSNGMIMVGIATKLSWVVELPWITELFTAMRLLRTVKLPPMV